MSLSNNISDKAFAMLYTGTKELIALGRLTLAFSAIDEAIVSFMVGFAPGLQDRQDEAIQTFAKLCFSDKVSLLRTMIMAYAKRTNVSPYDLGRTLDQLLTLAMKRNDYIHGWVTLDTRHRPIFANRAKNRTSRGTAKDIEDLANSLRKSLDRFLKLLGQFISQASDAMSSEAG